MHDTLTGQKIGRWAIGEEFKKNKRIYHNCICDCGNTKDVSRQTLLNGSSLSCGCYARENTSKISSKDYTGKKFSKLNVMERLPNYKDSKTFYRCVCDCGNTRIVYSYDLTSGKVTMCKDCREKERLNERRKDYTGQVFGKLTVRKMIYGKYEKRKHYVIVNVGTKRL